MFCDLVGSTELADRSDPEEVREILRSYQRVAGEVVERHGGMVSRYQGDGLFIYFGFPTAADDDPVRAVDAGLEIVQSVSALGAEIGAGHLAVRVGVDTGVVVVGEMGWGQRVERDDIVGDTPNIAARVEALAAPGTVLVSERTWRLVDGYFEGRDRGAEQLRGIERPIRLVEIVGHTGADDRSDLPGHRTRLVGRDAELARVVDALVEASRAGGVIAITGDAGMGKSRLLSSAVSRVGLRDIARVRCSPGGSATPFDALVRAVAAQPGRLAAMASERAAARRAGTTPDVLADDIDLVETMVQRRPPGAGLADRRRRHDAMLRVIRAADRDLWVLEDMHFADSATVDLVAELTASPGGVALAVTARRLPAGLEGLAAVEVGPLAPPAVRRLVESLAGRRTLSNATVNLIVARCGGNPLFIEEVVNAALEAGDAIDRADLVPPTLHGSLMGRLDRLGPHKETAQRCAVLGASFRREDARIVCEGSDDDVDRHLEALEEAGVLIASPDGLEFRHLLLREVAYESLLKSTRRELHGRVAAHFDAQGTNGIPHEVRAFHYQEGGMPDLAVEHWRRAARLAARRSDFPEALRHVRNGLRVLETTPPGPVRDRNELDFLHSRALGLGLVGQRARQELRDTLERAVALAESLGDEAKLLALLFMRITAEHGFGNFDGATALVERAAALTQRPGLAGSKWSVMHLEGATLLWQGHVSAALPPLVAAAAEAERFDKNALDPGTASVAASCLCSAGLAEWLAGEGDGLAWFGQGRELAAAARAPQATCLTMATEALLHQLAGNVEEAGAQADGALQFGAESGNTWDEWAEVISWWARAARSGRREDVDGLARCLATSDPGRQHLRPYFLGLLADRLLAVGDDDVAAQTVGEAIALARRNNEGFSLPELLRLQAQVLARGGDTDRAATLLREGMVLAGLQGSKVFERRCRDALAELLAGAGAAAGSGADQTPR